MTIDARKYEELRTDANRLYKAAVKAREAQGRYFRTRDHDALIDARRAEEELDRVLSALTVKAAERKRRNQVTPEQTVLF